MVALNQATGAVIASLTLANDYNLVGGAFDKTTGHLFVVDTRTNTARVAEVNSATGAEIGGFALPFNASNQAGLTVNPTTGNLWYGSDYSNSVVELSKTGTVLRTVNLTLQGVPATATTGLGFDASGALLVSTTSGVVYKADVTSDLVAQSFATLTGITALAPDGTPAVAGQASANAGQVITLTGTNFGAGTEVLFDTRDASGAVVRSNQAPLAINAAGTVLQVVVPTLASTGLVQVVNTGGRNLGFGSYNDAVYRQVSASYTPAAAASAIRFADLGLQGLDNESWGIDNVRVVQNGAVVFADDFEGGAKANWSAAITDATLPGVFTQFSGRFSNGAQTLNLTGLVAGQAVTVTFDLYVLDSWDGTNTSAGPDVFQVSADGQVLRSDTFTNYASNSSTSTQSYGASAGIRLQIVPTLTATTQPGTDTAFTLTGSGFQEGASTVTVGGVSLADAFTNQASFDVTGSSNTTLQVTLPLVLDGPVKVTTAGGSASVAGPVAAAQPPSLFTAIRASAAVGAAADGTKPSANVGQTITLVGQGFTGSTLVQFAGVDDTGMAGTLTRTGTAGTNGTTLTIVVPELARTGAVTVLGSGTSLALQVVPVLRGVGGAVVAGGQVLLDGTGLVGSELTVTVDGRAAGTFAVRTVADVNAYNTTTPGQGQQLLSLTVPAGVTAGVITVVTVGGSFVLHTGVSVAASTSSPAADVGDTITAATAVSLAQDSRVTISGKTNDGTAAAGLDVDLYKLVLTQGDQLTLGLTGSSYIALRVFDATGTQLALQYGSPGSTASLVFTAPALGTYYVGVSTYGNTTYNPATAGSGTASNYPGIYQLALERLGTGDSRLSGATATASTGTPARVGIASANVGQTLTLAGTGLAAGEKLLFSAIDTNGNRSWSSATAATVAADGTSLTVVVPNDATTGTVRLARDPAGILLQIVPHLTHVDASAGSTYDGTYLTLTGSGFAEGATSVQFGTTTLADSGRNDGLDVSNNYAGGTQQNGSINLTVPNGAPTGPVTVTTLGGTSEVAGPAFTAVTATATTGTPANAALPSANPGQAITITGTGLQTTTDIVFETIDASGTRSQVLVQPATVNNTGTSATITVPINATTGKIRIVADQNATQAILQIIPTISAVAVQSVASDGTTATLVLTGSGYVEGAATYKFGSTTVADTSLSQGPDVSSSYYYNGGYYYTVNNSVTVTVSLVDGSFGPVVVTGGGGSSSAYVVSLSSVSSVALSGVPADALVASANPGQAVTLVGSNLSVLTPVLFHYVDSGGVGRVVVLTPVAASGNGTQATVVIPPGANGVGKLQVFGSSTQPVLQIVPVLNTVAANGSNLVLNGAGFVEGAGTYKVGGASVVDSSVTAGPDVTYGYNPSYADNVTANLADPVHGFGTASVTTAGGTSASLAVGTLYGGLGYVQGVAVDPASGSVWVADNANPDKLHRLDPATGAELSTLTLAASSFPYQQYYGGVALQVVPAAFTLGATTVPVGSLLVFYGNANPDRGGGAEPGHGGGDCEPDPGQRLQPGGRRVRQDDRAPVRGGHPHQYGAGGRGELGDGGGDRRVRPAVQREQPGGPHGQSHDGQSLVWLGLQQLRGGAVQDGDGAADGEPDVAGCAGHCHDGAGLRCIGGAAGEHDLRRGLQGRCHVGPGGAELCDLDGDHGAGAGRHAGGGGAGVGQCGPGDHADGHEFRCGDRGAVRHARCVGGRGAVEPGAACDQRGGDGAAGGGADLGVDRPGAGGQHRRAQPRVRQLQRRGVSPGQRQLHAGGGGLGDPVRRSGSARAG